MSESNKLEILVSKLLKNTLDNKMEWITLEPSEIETNKYPDDFIELIYYSHNNNRFFRLFERKYLIGVENKIALKQLFDYSKKWDSTITLNIYHSDYIPIVEINNIAILNDLYKVVKKKILDSDIDKLLDDLND